MDCRKAEEENQRHLQAAMKAVGQAIQLDSSGNRRDAYLHYLSCMQYISQCLLQDARNRASQSATVALKTKTSQRMVKLAQQCSERVADIMSNMEETPSMAIKTLPHIATSPAPSPPPLASSLVPSGSAGGRISPSMFPPVPTSFTHSSPTHVAVVRPTVQHPGQQGLPVLSSNSALDSDESLGPLEKAFRENRKLMAAYRSRLNRMHTSKNKAMVNLTFQRRLMENMAIAKAREASIVNDQLAKKIKERQQRLQEQAAQRFSSSGQPTKEELEMRMVYANILEYENVKNWLKDWRHRLQESPGDIRLVKELITEILSCEDHPLTQLLKRYQITIYHKIMPLIQKELLNIEEIVVPYKDVEPLDLRGPRAVPEGGFTTPDELDETMEDTLAKRLFALRENSSSSLDSESTDLSQTGTSASRLEENMLDNLLEEQEEDDEEGRSDDNRPVFHDDEESGCNTDSAVVGHHRHWERNGNAERPVNEMVKEEKNVVCDDDNEDRIANGKGSSHPSDATTTERTRNGSSSVDGDDILSNDVEADDNSNVTERMRDIVGEVREEVQRALEDGERCCKELEEGDNDVSDTEVVMTTGDSMDDMNGNDHENSDNGRSEGCEDDGRTKSDKADEEAMERTKQNNGEVNGKRHERDDQSCGQNGTANDDDIAEEEEEAQNGEGCTEQMEGPEGNGTAQTALNGEGQNEEVEEKKKEGKGDGKEEEKERIAEMRAEAIQRHVKTISKDVLMFTERVHNLLVAVYEQLNSTVAKEQCIAVIESFFFRDIWKPLLMLYRRYNYKKEQFVAIAMTKYQHAMPQHIGVAEKFCLLGEGALQDGCQAANAYPYQPAVEELCKLQGYTCPLQKLECIVRVSRVIIECVEDFYESQGKPRQSQENLIGCDDLLPILSYVIMKSALPQIVSECSGMEEFIHEGYLFGEEGYCLTTCMTALSYVLKLGSTEEQPA